ncbi:XRE family transcriptional regulator [Paractinoplanes rishiriensis]|uniref:Transcriptional regulator n=1 Tax=Paractinoplanes rishiriensis TaxID=1050105 RepID=A0A919K829_9ACTN|nr:XRE family transcriptional regulator [Actinoplanes rishiriensis]GIF01789.1 transcriptional regulator [Actinoplanes rishiriensis]
MNAIDVAARLGVDPKTVDRWLAGRQPYPRHRNALVELTGWPQRSLWPELPRAVEPITRADEVRIVYPHRSAVPADTWPRFFARAEREIDVLAHSALFLAEDIVSTTVMCDKARAGVRVRIVLGDPDGAHIVSRGAEERIGDAHSARIRAALIQFSPVAEAGAELRLHDTALYNSIYRADDELLVNAHVYGHPASHAPVIHLRRRGSEGIARTYLQSFENIWARSSGYVA